MLIDFRISVLYFLNFSYGVILMTKKKTKVILGKSQRIGKDGKLRKTITKPVYDSTKKKMVNKRMTINPEDGSLTYKNSKGEIVVPILVEEVAAGSTSKSEKIDFLSLTDTKTDDLMQPSTKIEYQTTVEDKDGKKKDTLATTTIGAIKTFALSVKDLSLTSKIASEKFEPAKTSLINMIFGILKNVYKQVPKDSFVDVTVDGQPVQMSQREIHAKAIFENVATHAGITSKNFPRYKVYKNNFLKFARTRDDQGNCLELEREEKWSQMVERSKPPLTDKKGKSVDVTAALTLLKTEIAKAIKLCESEKLSHKGLTNPLKKVLDAEIVKSKAFNDATAIKIADKIKDDAEDHADVEDDRANFELDKAVAI